MNILTGYDWRIEYSSHSSYTRQDGTKIKDLNGHFSFDIKDTPGLQEFTNYRVGLCLIRKRSKPIILRCILTSIILVGTTYEVDWHSDGQFDPVPKCRITEGKECKIFI